MKPAEQIRGGTDTGLFNAVFDQASMGMAIRANDPRESRWLRVNQKFCDLLGYTREELLQLTTVDISHPEDLELSLEYNRQVLQGDWGGDSVELRYLRKDGIEIWTETSLSAVPAADGNPARVILVIHDITQRKQAEDAEALLSKVYQSSPALFTVSSPNDGSHYNVNDAWSSITGYSREEALTNTVRGIDIWAIAEDREKFVAMIEENVISKPCTAPKPGTKKTCSSRAKRSISAAPHAFWSWARTSPNKNRRKKP